MTLKVGDKVTMYGYFGEILELADSDGFFQIKVYGVSADGFIVGKWSKEYFRKLTKLERALS